MLAAELHHRGRTRYAVFGLQRARLVINSRMDDATVVSGLMTSDRGFFFENCDTTIAKSVHGLERSGQPDNATADDHEIKLQSFLSMKR